MRRRAGAPLLVAILIAPGAAHAHSFGKLYNLPIPFWLYAWGAAGALLLSFLLVGWFVSQPVGAVRATGRDLDGTGWVRALHRWRVPLVLQATSVFMLGLCIATGLFGTRNSYLNFNMTFFWIVFVLGFTYLTAVWGDLWALVNPWKVATQWLAPRRPVLAGGATLGVWPALGFYFVFIWLELFGQVRPLSLSVVLLAYSAINLAGAWLIGWETWFRHCEFFSVFLRQVSRMAPLHYEPVPGGRGRLRLRWPFAGLLDGPATGRGEVVFILFMLSSTAFDGLRETAPWKQIFWIDLRRALEPVIGTNIVETYATLRAIIVTAETLCLAASPFLYLGTYLAAIALARALVRSDRSIRELALLFAPTLLPIALVYNVTHYYTLVVTQGPQILRLVSDPFGAGWNLFGTALWMPPRIFPSMGVVWHTQVGLILAGHIVSVVVAHLVALQVFPSRALATRSQWPMLVLMVAFTTVGLWILSLPITEQVIGV